MYNQTISHLCILICLFYTILFRCPNDSSIVACVYKQGVVTTETRPKTMYDTDSDNDDWAQDDSLIDPHVVFTLWALFHFEKHILKKSINSGLNDTFSLIFKQALINCAYNVLLRYSQNSSVDHSNLDAASDSSDIDDFEDDPCFPELIALIEQALEQLGGEVVPKLNWSCPRVYCLLDGILYTSLMYYEYLLLIL